MICNKYIIEVAENVHEHDQSQSHLWEIDKCLNELLIYMKPKIDSTGVEGQLPLSRLDFSFARVKKSLAIFCRKPPKDCFSVSRMFF